MVIPLWDRKMSISFRAE